MGVNIPCFTYGLSSEDLETCRRALAMTVPEDAQVDLIPITAVMLPRLVGQILDEVGMQSLSSRAEPLPAAGAVSVVFIGTQARETINGIMQGCKSVWAGSGELIFVMVTATATGWTFQYYLDHVIEEHEYMKSHDPRDEPEMRRL